MSEQALKRILVAVAALVVAYGLASLVTGRAGSDAGDTAALASALDGLDAASVQEVVFQRPRDTVRLTPSDGSWAVNGYAADSARAAGLWSALDPEGIDGVVARNPQNHARLGVAADSAPRAVFRTVDGETTTLLVGNTGPTYSSAYVRLEGADEVVLLDGELRSAARRGVDAWRDKEIVRVDTSAVARLDVTRDGARSVLERSQDGWTVDGEAADEASVHDLLRALARLEASGFAPDTAVIRSPDRRLAALNASGDTLAALELESADGSDVRVRANGDATVYHLSSYRADRLTPEAAQLRSDGQSGG